MLELHLNIKPQTARRLRKVFELYPDQETLAQNIIAYQIAELNKASLNLRLDLKEFEEKYQRTSKDFYKQFCEGNTDDREDYVIWAGLYEMWCDNERQLVALQ